MRGTYNTSNSTYNKFKHSANYKIKIFLYKFEGQRKQKEKKELYKHKNNVFHRVLNKQCLLNRHYDLKECLESIMEDNYYTYFYHLQNIYYKKIRQRETHSITTNTERHKILRS